MNIKILIISTLSLAHCVFGDQICYDGYGCFTNDPPFSGSLARPVGLLPQKPSTIQTRFFLYTRNNPLDRVEVSSNSTTSLFNPYLPTKLIIHGFIHDSLRYWVLNIKDALLEKGDFNVITVDWSKANGLPYTQATANTQIVGVDIAILLQSFASRFNMVLDQFHIIGHSLGAHIAGYAGKRLQGRLGRITGLDPAGPYFENTDPVVRLDKSDAKFVDCIHSDGASTINLGFGLLQPLGHVDFYPNGGKNQPNCPADSDKILQGFLNLATFDLSGVKDSFSCSHDAAHLFFLDSIKHTNCEYVAFPCESYEKFSNGECLECGPEGCNQAGIKATPYKDKGMLFYTTRSADKDSYPYCHHLLKVTLSSNNLQGQTQARGKFSLVLLTNEGTSGEVVVDDSENTLKAGSEFTKMVGLIEKLGSQIEAIVVSYKKTSNFFSSFLYQNDWSFINVEIYHPEAQRIFKFCPSKPFITSGSPQEFYKC